MTSPRKAFSLRIPPVLRGRLEELAEENGVSLNGYVTLALLQFTGLPRSHARARATREHEPKLEQRIAARQEKAAVVAAPPARNAPCPCGSGKKSKRCCFP